jgi:tetratricopeptide (TPR) repeat protein
MAIKKSSASIETQPPIENPQTAEEFAERGWFNYSKKSYEHAETDFRRSLDLSPDNADVMYALGLNLAAAGKSQEAISTFEDVIEFLDDRITDETRVRYYMLIRLSRGHINRIKTGEWRLDVYR